jgi:predicted  nucleic acid-binding Zn-ribbon protein
MGIFAFLRLFGARLMNATNELDEKLGIVIANQKRMFGELRSIMANLDKVQADQAETKISLAEIRMDLNSVRTINDTHKATILAHEALIADLRQQLIDAGGNTAILDAIQASAEELKNESRQIAEIVSPEAPPTA